MVIENPDEKLFRCGNETCSKVTCRLCKKADHIPKSCKEVEDEAGKEASLHKVAEAMSAAAIRKCPKPTCGQPYVKEEGACDAGWSPLTLQVVTSALGQARRSR